LKCHLGSKVFIQRIQKRSGFFNEERIFTF
jgi:hypothetical protein